MCVCVGGGAVKRIGGPFELRQKPSVQQSHQMLKHSVTNWRLNCCGQLITVKCPTYVFPLLPGLNFDRSITNYHTVSTRS